MSAMPTNKNARLDMRISKESKGLLQKAAALTEQDLSSFVMSAALKEARATLEFYEEREHTTRDQSRLFDLLTRPPKVNERLKHAIARYQKLQGDQK